MVIAAQVFTEKAVSELKPGSISASVMVLAVCAARWRRASA